jgi:glycosyltransferase involved in cell wall biosynthesis
VNNTYSIIIPAYNESARICGTLEKILAFVRSQGWSAEIIVVNDGSTDGTSLIVQGYAARHPNLRIIENPGNRGKGYSVRNGMLHATGEILLFSDADLSTPIEDSTQLLDAIERGADVAIGSRWLRTELQVQPQPLHRRIFGRAFNLALRLVLGLGYKDTQCGFKAFTRCAAQTIFPLQHIERWGFDPEILFLAMRFGFRVEEVPVQWAHREGTHISPLRDGMKMLLEMLRVRWYAITGKYDVRPASVPAAL